MSDLFRKAEKAEIKPKETAYSQFGFTRNPFPSKTSITINDNDDRNNGSIYLPDLRKKENGEFEKICIPNPNRGEANKIISFLMDYATRRGRGIGKTAFLNYQRKRIIKDLGKELTGESEVLFAIYISPRPGDNYKKFSFISKFIIEELIDQDILSLAVCRMKAFSGQIDDSILDKVTNENIQATIGSDQWLDKQHKEIGKSFDAFNLSQSIKSSMINENIDTELATALSRFGHDNDELKKFYFLAQKDFFWKKSSSKILFDDLVKVFRLAGFTKGLILFDELEKIVPKLNSQDRREFCESLRYYFIDGTSENTRDSFYQILLTIHPYLQELLVPHWEASGLQRFASLGGELANNYTIYFEPLDEGNAIPLAIEYMDRSRVECKNPGTSTMPFDNDALKEALKKTLGVPGRYLNFLHSTIEKAIESKWTKIGKDEISKVEMPVNPSEKEVDADDSPLAAPKIDL